MDTKICPEDFTPILYPDFANIETYKYSSVYAGAIIEFTDWWSQNIAEEDPIIPYFEDITETTNYQMLKFRERLIAKISPSSFIYVDPNLGYSNEIEFSYEFNIRQFAHDLSYARKQIENNITDEKAYPLIALDKRIRSRMDKTFMRKSIGK